MNFTLSVLSGLHRGAEINLSLSLSGNVSVTLGSDVFNTDITLLDPGILPVHCRFSAEKTGFRLCENNSSDPLKQGNHTILPGNYIAYGKPFECAGTKLSVKYKTPGSLSLRKIVSVFFIFILVIPAIWFIADYTLFPASSAGNMLSGEPYRCLTREINNSQWIIRGFVSTEKKKELINYLKQQDIIYQLDVITPDPELKKLNRWLMSVPNNHLTAVLNSLCGYVDIQGIRAPHQQDTFLTDSIPEMLISSKILINDRSQYLTII